MLSSACEHSVPRRLPTHGLALTLVLAPLAGACASGPPLPRGFAAALDGSPDDMPVRFATEDDRLVGLSVPVDHRSVPADLRRILEAIAPGGSVTYCARELGGNPGWRLEKIYPSADEAAEPHTRSVWLRDDGTVVERTHQLPIGQVPETVLQGALGIGNDVSQARVVQAREGEEWFRFRVENAIGWPHEVDVALDGEVMGIVRLKPAEVRAAVR